MIDLDLFKPWLAHLNWQHRQWFAKALEYISLKDFKLHETNENTVWEGKPITLKKGDCYIVASRQIKTEARYLRPGISLENEAETYEISISVNTPLEVVFCAVKHLNGEEES